MRKSIAVGLPVLMLLAISILFVTSFDIVTTSSAQNANSSRTTNKNQNQNDTRSIMSTPSGGGAPQDFSKNTWELPADADKTKNPTMPTTESIAKGKELPRENERQLYLLSWRDRVRKRSKPCQASPQTGGHLEQRADDGNDRWRNFLEDLERHQRDHARR